MNIDQYKMYNVTVIARKLSGQNEPPEETRIGTFTMGGDRLIGEITFWLSTSSNRSIRATKNKIEIRAFDSVTEEITNAKFLISEVEE